MIESIIRLFGYMIAELLPLGGDVHYRLLGYYFKYPALSHEALIIAHVVLITGLCIYFARDMIRMFRESLKGVWVIVSGRATIKRACTDLKMLNMLLVVLLITLVAFFLVFIRSEYSYSLYVIGGMMILSAIVLRVAEVFTLIKVDAKVASPRDALIFGALQAICMIPGIMRPAMFMSVGRFLGLEKKHLARMIFISLIPVLAFELVFVVGMDPMQTVRILYHSWLLCLILLALIVVSVDIVLAITTSPSYYKFYYYLGALGLWTIFDVFFAKRGL